MKLFQYRSISLICNNKDLGDRFWPSLVEIAILVKLCPYKSALIVLQGRNDNLDICLDISLRSRAVINASFSIIPKCNFFCNFC